MKYFKLPVFQGLSKISKAAATILRDRQTGKKNCWTSRGNEDTKVEKIHNRQSFVRKKHKKHLQNLIILRKFSSMQIATPKIQTANSIPRLTTFFCQTPAKI